MARDQYTLLVFSLLIIGLFITPLLAKPSDFLNSQVPATGPVKSVDESGNAPARVISGEKVSKKVRGGQGLYFSLKHRDSPGSPFRQRYRSRHDYLQTALQRDDLRAQTFVTHIKDKTPRFATGTLANKLAADVAERVQCARDPLHPSTLVECETGPMRPPAGAGEYYSEFYIGTPPQLVLAMVDLGSDLVWIPEYSCRFCPKLTSIIKSYFFPTSSSSFTPLPSLSDSCRKIEGTHVEDDTTSCMVHVGSAEGYWGAPEFALESVRLNGSARHRRHAIKKLLIGVSGVQVPTGGVLGLGQGKMSFASQLGKFYLPASRNKFSYCLADTDEPTGSSLIFGGYQPDTDLLFTPLNKHPHVETFYYVNLVGVAVNGVKLPISSDIRGLNEAGEGGAIIDPGTSFSKFPQPVFELIVAAFKSFTKLPMTSVPGFALCYNISNIAALPFPTVSLIFEGQVEMKLPVENSLVVGNEQGDAMCLAMVPGAPGAPSIIGGTQQQNFYMVFDRERSRLGFAPRLCASSSSS